MMQTVINVAALVIMIIGMIMALFPVLPGTPVIFAAILIYGLIDSFQHFGFWFILLMLLLTAASYLVDNLASWWGAKKYGASKIGAWGAVIGGIAGVLINPIIGLILGPSIGAIAAELIFARRNFNDACRIGLGTFLGFLGGSLARFVIGLAMVVSFIYQIY
jgi:uncharacterized protein YqgC (DUF456 family)